MEQEKILVDVWGTTMRFVDFYRVLKETDKSMTVVKIGSKEEYDGHLEGTATPDLSKSGDRALRVMKKLHPNGKDMLLTAKFESNLKHYPVEWDGKPKRFNHCD